MVLIKKHLKSGTPSSRKHHFESFTQRVAKLKIDPVRRVQRQEIEKDATSFFKAGLAHWREINLSANFTAFLREVDPFCDTLPQILHHQEAIVGAVLKFIARRDVLSLEPLCSLVAHLAHDLGVRFEGHWAAVISLVSDVAASHPDVEVLEWSFTCLAWLFKYLARLLVPDLRPTYDIMAPLLGKQPQKRHVTRFAAEAMSFLVRKAASAQGKERRPLENLLTHMLDDLSSSQQETRMQHQRGIMTLLADGIKGINRGIHTWGTAIYQGLLDKCFMATEDESLMVISLIQGVTINLIHDTDVEGFRPIQGILASNILQMPAEVRASQVDACARLLEVICTTRKGSRISDWQLILEALAHLQKIHVTTPRIETMNPTDRASAVILQLAPFEMVVSPLHALVEGLSLDGARFVDFCHFFADLDMERFQKLLSSDYFRFVATDWLRFEDQVLSKCPRLLCAAVDYRVMGAGVVLGSSTWRKACISSLAACQKNPQDLFRAASYLDSIDTRHLNALDIAAVHDHLPKIIQGVAPENGAVDPMEAFVHGIALRADLDLSSFSSTESRLNWHQLCSNLEKFGAMPLYLENLMLFCATRDVTWADEDMEALYHELSKNLASPSHELRMASLRLLRLAAERCGNGGLEVLDTALTIESASLDLQHARSIAMHIRRLSSQYRDISQYTGLSKAVVAFCFGILTFRLSPLWEDSIAVLKSICALPGAEEQISTIVFEWLESQPSLAVSGSKDPPIREYDEFESLQQAQVDLMAATAWHEARNPGELLARSFEARHSIVSRSVVEARRQSIRVLCAIPHLAEKRSRRLVPLFLNWMTDAPNPEVIKHTRADDAQSKPSPEIVDRLDRKDKKSLLELFGHFDNPRVLFQADQVFSRLQSLLASGDSDLQKAALKAICTWKMDHVRPYLENLENLLDDTRFRDELSVFLQVDEESGAINDDHRPELMPILLRLLYGRIISKAVGNSSQGSKRRAVLGAISRMSNSYIHQFLNIVLGDLHKLKLGESLLTVEMPDGRDLASDPRNRLGLFNMLKDMLEVLGDRLSFLTGPIANAVVYCADRPSQHSSASSLMVELEGQSQPSLDKSIRQAGLQCLILLFKSCPITQLRPYLPIIFRIFINDRLEKLPIETAQAVSGLLQLFSVWAATPESALFLSEFNSGVVRSIIACLEVPSAKDEVKIFVLDQILKPLIHFAKTPQGQTEWTRIRLEVLSPHVDQLLESTNSLLRKNPSKVLLGSTIELVSEVANIAQSSSQISSLLNVCSYLLDRPSQRVSPKSKGELLQILQHFIPLAGNLSDDLQSCLYRTVSSLFGYFKDRTNRLRLCAVLEVLSFADVELAEAAVLCTKLNAFSTRLIDDPDFEVRLHAFDEINETKYATLTMRQWRPIVWNMLYYVRDREELAIRSSAALVLRRFIEATADGQPSDLLSQVLLPALRSGSSEESELVRSEYLSIMAQVVRKHSTWSEVKDLTCLLFNDDDEASFFNNILHIQHHRRSRALRRLAVEASGGHLASSNIVQFLLPLLEHFVFEKADNENAHNLAGQTIEAIGVLSEHLEWPQVRAVFRRYASYITSKPELEKSVIKLISAVVDAIGRASEARSAQAISNTTIGANGADNGHEAREAETEHTLSRTMPRQDNLTKDLTSNLLPSLLIYLHNKDESTVSLRIPVAVSIVKMLKLLPPNEVAERLPPVLTDVSHILRSRSQESRDLTRKTLVEISTLVGPQCFGFVLKELRGALARGYQLHVLSYTVHSILVATAPIFKPGDLDYCLSQVMAIIMDDVLGATAQEKEAEEYISQMKEVKSNKSYDSLELVARTATIANLSALLQPLQSLLAEKLDLKMARRIDELLRRISVGLLANESVQTRDTLMLCYEIIQETYKSQGELQPAQEHERVKRFLVNTKAPRMGSARATSSHSFKMMRFAFDLLRLVLHKFAALKTPENLAGFLPAIGDALVQGHEDVQISAMRLLATVIRVPLQELDEGAGVFVAEAVKVIQNAVSTSTELAQAALKLVSAVLRERFAVRVKDSDIAYLLSRVKADLNEPDRQGITFNFLKAVLSRKIMIPEVYQVMDMIAAMMVTSHAPSARDLARGAYFQFILHYPQSKDRFTKQIAFLVKNLDYAHIEGRQSVMEAIHLLVPKVDEAMMQELVATFFVPIVMVIINDDAAECRKMAAVLLKTLLERADSSNLNHFRTVMHTWLDQKEPLLARMALQVYGILAEIDHKAAADVPYLLKRANQIVSTATSDPKAADWELCYAALQLGFKLCQAYPEALFDSSNSPFWKLVYQCLSFPHAWVKLAASKLLGLLLADVDSASANGNPVERPMKGSGSLLLCDDDLTFLIRASLNGLRTPGLGGELADQIVRNLVVLGRVVRTDALLTLGVSIEATEDNDEDSSSELQTDSKTTLQYMFERLSAILRKEPLTTKAPSLIPATASLHVLAALCSHLPSAILAPHLSTILLPLHNLTDSTIPAPYSPFEAFRSAYKALETDSQETMMLLQEKLGTTAYVQHLSRVRAGVKERREGRRIKRRLEAVTAPEKVAQEKRRKGERKKEKRKERSGEERGRRRGW